MTAEPVDVMGVLVGAINNVLRPNGGAYVDEMEAARAAIAELLEAAREASATLGHIYHTTPLPPVLERHAHDGYQRLDAAIAGASPPKARNQCEHSWATKMVTGGPVRVCQNCGIAATKGIANV